MSNANEDNSNSSNSNIPSTSSQSMGYVISSGNNFNIEKLEGTSNYSTWKFQMKLLFIECGLWEYVTGTTKDQDITKDQKAYAKICLSVKPLCYPHIRNAKTAAETWECLKNAYENVGIRLQLKRKLSQIVYKNFDLMDHYLGEILSTTQELADIGCNVDDEELAELIQTECSSNEVENEAHKHPSINSNLSDFCLPDDSDSSSGVIMNSSENNQISNAEGNTEENCKRLKRVPTFKDYEMNYFMYSALISRNEPNTYQAAINSENKDCWLEAMREEYNSLLSHDVWELVDRPKNANIIKCKWVFKEKTDEDGNFSRYKARLVAKGFTQRYGVDYEETFAPVVRHSTLRMLFAIGVEYDMDIEHIDVNTAFLNGDLHETIFMEQPTGFQIEGQNKVCLLKKSLYGLKQASRAWNEKLQNLLKSNGFQQLKSEKCVYFKDFDSSKIIIALYVDDIFIFSNCKKVKEQLADILNDNFKVKFLGPVKQVLGIKVERNRGQGTLKLSQRYYIDKLLKKFGMENCHSISTPMEANLKLEKASVCDQNFPYQELIGSLMFLSVCTRPDIAYSCSKLSQYNTCFDKRHWIAAKRVLRYLSGTKNHGLFFKKGGCKIVISCDADWAGDIDRRSYSGFVTKLGSSTINWESHKQQAIACSSTEAEYYSLGDAVKEAKYIRNFFSELKMINLHEPIIIYNDNQSTHKIVQNQNFRRTKHIVVKYHFIQEAMEREEIVIKYQCSNDLVADILTKALGKTKHKIFVNELSMI